MAKQVGPVFFTGTIDGLIFYKLGDHYYIRSKGSYKSARHMRRNPKYKRTLQQADRFGEASKLLQAVYYRQLPKAVRKHGLYGKLTGMINSWLYQGKSKEEVKGLLMAHLQQLAAAASTPPTLQEKATPAPIAVPGTTKQCTTKQQTTNNDQRSISTPQRTTLKQARYLSKWKVKHNGRLQVPQSVSQLATVTPLPYSAGFTATAISMQQECSPPVTTNVVKANASKKPGTCIT